MLFSKRQRYPLLLALADQLLIYWIHIWHSLQPCTILSDRGLLRHYHTVTRVTTAIPKPSTREYGTAAHVYQARTSYAPHTAVIRAHCSVVRDGHA